MLSAAKIVLESRWRWACGKCLGGKCFISSLHSYYFFYSCPLVPHEVQNRVCIWWYIYIAWLRWARGLLTHWGRDKWPPFSRGHFQMHFLEWKFINFDWYFTKACSQGSIICPLSELKMESLLTHICVTRPRRVKHTEVVWKMIAYRCLKFCDSFTKQPLKLMHVWVIISHILYGCDELPIFESKYKFSKLVKGASDASGPSKLHGIFRLAFLQVRKCLLNIWVQIYPFRGLTNIN